MPDNEDIKVGTKDRGIDPNAMQDAFTRAYNEAREATPFPTFATLLPNFAIRESIERISKADPSDVQRIAGSQLELLAGYHEIVLAQSRRSFFWALIGAGIGLLFFLSAVAFAITTSTEINALIPLLSGAIVEVVAGIIFFLYSKAAGQLSSFHARLEVLQRYLLANSICESLKGEDRAKARLELIQQIARGSFDAVQKS